MRISATIIVFLICLLAFGFSSDAKDPDGAEPGRNGNVSARIAQDARLRDAFIGYICARLGKEKEDVALSRFTVSGNETLPDGEISLEAPVNRRDGKLQGYVRLVASAGAGKYPAKEVVLSGWVEVFGPVVCASRNLKKGGILAEKDIYMAKKNITRLNRGALTDMSSVVGYALKNDVSADDPIREPMLNKAALVMKGEMVTILAELRGIRITAPGRALEKGGPGDPVKVQNLMSKKSIYAKVVDGATVKVDF